MNDNFYFNDVFNYINACSNVYRLEGITMIALNKELPKTCFNCPCFTTYVLDKENIPNIQYLIRFCEATKQELVVLEWDKSETIPDIWMNFSKPNWCPWIDVGNAGLKWTMTFSDDEDRWHHNMAGFGGDY